MSNQWANEYLKTLAPGLFPQEDSGGHNRELDNLQDAMVEIYALWQSSSAVRCLRMAFAALQACASDTPPSVVADLIECADDCTRRILAYQEALPELMASTEAACENGDAHA